MNPFTGKEYSDNAKKLRLLISTYPASDPLILKKLDELFTENNVVIVKAETGAGKGVVIAPHILELVFASGTKVFVTQPRTVNTHTAEYLKSVLDNPEIVDYSYRFANNITTKTQLIFVTDGLLLNLIYNGFSTENMVLIIDEIHERNKNIDQLMLLSKILNIKLVIMSATLDIDFYKQYFKTNAVLEIPGRTHEVTHIFTNSEEDYVKQATNTVIKLLPEIDKDILIFLNSPSELKKACKLLEPHNISCYELHKGTSQELREIIIAPNSTQRRKVVFSTNIAESGITLQGIGYVIDCGRRYESIFNSQEEMYELVLSFISRAEAEQRAGRAGRTAPGTCYHLYSESDYKNMIQFKTPDIEKEEISDFLLQLISFKNTLKFTSLKEYVNKLPTPPSAKQFNFGIKILISAGLITDNEELTDLGIEVVKIPLISQQAVCLLKAKSLHIENDICKILAMISIEPDIQNWFITISEKDKNYSDFLTKQLSWRNSQGDIFIFLKMLNKFLEYGDKASDWCKKNYLHFSKFTNAKKQFFKLLDTSKKINKTNFWKTTDPNTTNKKIIESFTEGYKLNIAERIGKTNTFKIQRPSENITISKTPFIEKLKKKIIFLNIRKIGNQIKVSTVFNI